MPLFCLCSGLNSYPRPNGNEVIVALANKIARVAWKMLIKPGEIYRWADA